MSARLTSLSVENFRSIRGKIDVELDAPVVLIHGANGSGKTSFLSALELGLTGHVNSLQRSKTEDANDLIHVGAQKAVVTVGTNHPELGAMPSEITVSDAGITGHPLLTEQQTRFYTERCFLAQSILGRLLEIYEGDDARSDASPLTRFVQELLGLDVLDNIIDGLHHLKHVKRLRKSIPLFEEIEDERASILDRVTTLEAQLEGTVQERSTLELDLKAALSPFDVDELKEPTEAAKVVIKQDDDRAKSEQLSVLKREVAAAQSLLATLSSAFDTKIVSGAEKTLQMARTSLEAWRTSHESTLLASLTAAAKLLPNLSDANVVGYADAHTDATNAVSNELERKSRRLQEDRENSVLRDQTREAVEKSKSRLARLDTRVAALSKGSGDLATVLSELVPLIQDDHCPVCDRDFSEVAETPLRAHLATHISSLSRMANELQEVVTERQAENTLNEQNMRLVTELQTKVLSENARNTLVAEIARLSEVSQRLSSSRSAAIEGETLSGKERSASSSLSVLRQNQESLHGLRTSAETFPKQLGLESTAKDESLSQTLARCSDAIGTQQNEIDRKQADRHHVASIADSLQEYEALEKTLRNDLKAAKEKKARIDKAWTKADKTRELGKTLSDKTVSVRTNIVRRVFNESLNEIWRDLFIRLAPDERFIPAFAFPSAGSGPVVASLETIYRGENRLGNPRSMLSAGNLNTAALTLFMSLNLSVKPTLPWLVIDDPVQSMDEIHIAQFAALLRTLSRQRERQIIIAVHEKPLFDYLALELSPAYEGDRLVTIELSRSHDQNTECRYKMNTWNPDSVFSVPVAV